jgi:succinate dehydrogenase hydrophobic anchor subunit
MLWHEVTGVFFAIFALFFAQGAWRVRADYKQGSEHEHFLLYAAMAALFAYFAISAFVRSRKTHVG